MCIFVSDCKIGPKISECKPGFSKSTLETAQAVTLLMPAKSTSFTAQMRTYQLLLLFVDSIL